MRAFVLSGGANYGAQQAGALEVLFEQGIQPDLVMGVSAGALNAVWVAAHPTEEGVRELSRIWSEEAASAVPAVGPFLAVLRVIRGKDSLVSNDSLLHFVQRWPFATNTFGEFQSPRLFTVAAHYHTGALHIFGDDPHDRVIDGLMTSTAMPPFYPPWEVNGALYLDGGVTSHLPLMAAAERGATEIFALRNGYRFTSGAASPQRTVLSIGAHSVSLLVQRQVELEIAMVLREQPALRLHLIDLHSDDDPGLWNFRHAADLIAAGRRLTEDYLKAHDIG